MVKFYKLRNDIKIEKHLIWIWLWYLKESGGFNQWCTVSIPGCMKRMGFESVEKHKLKWERECVTELEPWFEMEKEWSGTYRIREKPYDKNVRIPFSKIYEDEIETLLKMNNIEVNFWYTVRHRLYTMENGVELNSARWIARTLGCTDERARKCCEEVKKSGLLKCENGVWYLTRSYKE